MKVNRLLAILFTLAFFSFFLTACGSSADSDSDGPTPTRRATPTPTSDHTPTVAPESPEEQDFVAIGRFFDSAEKICANPGTTPGEGSRFLLRFEDDHITPDLVMSDSGYQRRIWESWIRSAGLTGRLFGTYSTAAAGSLRQVSLSAYQTFSIEAVMDLSSSAGAHGTVSRKVE